MMRGMTAALELRHAHVHLALRPALGGCIEGLWFHALPVLRSWPVGTLTDVQHSACYPLVPFSNRLDSAQLYWRGAAYPLAYKLAGEAHAIHGVGWQRPWQVQEAGLESATLRLDHPADAAWPFAFVATQTFRLHSDSLEMSLHITNLSPGDAPVGLGWHPYFVKRPGSQLQFAATGLWQMGADKLPTTRSASIGLDTPCAALDIDHCFDGWSGQARLRDPLLDIRLSADVQRLVVYTQPQLDCLALEPVSHVNNAMNHPHDAQARGVVVLAAGQSWQARMGIRMARRDTTPSALTHPFTFRPV
jgi:aldose 1-epimerase